MTYLSCPECHLSIHTRFASLTLEHCPRCIARRRVATPLVVSPGPQRRAPAEAAAAADELAGPRVAPETP